MAGSATLFNDYWGRIRTVVWQWTCDSSGNVSDVGILNLPGGTIHAFMSVPDSGVTDQFDLVVPIKILLPNGSSVSIADVLDGEGANLSNSTDGEWINLSNPFPLPYNSEVKITISNAGNAQSGTLFLHVWEEIN